MKNLFRNSINSYTLNITGLLGGALHFQMPHSPIAEGIALFHDNLFILLSAVVGFVFAVLFLIIRDFQKKRSSATTLKIAHHAPIEIVWTLIPAAILVVIAIPSFSLLYSIDEIVEPFYNFRVIGHQWYWSYEIVPATVTNATLAASKGSEGNSRSFDSYMLPTKELENLNTRPKLSLLAVDRYLWVPANTDCAAYVTSSDVIHAWAIPALGIKIDACPGRLNKTGVYINKPGYYFGQCSEICGVNHGFMPIGIYAPYSVFDAASLNFDLEAFRALQDVNEEDVTAPDDSLTVWNRLKAKKYKASRLKDLTPGKAFETYYQKRPSVLRRYKVSNDAIINTKALLAK